MSAQLGFFCAGSPRHSATPGRRGKSGEPGKIPLDLNHLGLHRRWEQRRQSLRRMLNNPLERGRAPIDTTFGIQSFSDVNDALHEDLEKMAVPPVSTTFCIKSLADVNDALHEDLERDGRATCQDDLGVQFFAYTNVTLHEDLGRNDRAT